MFKRIYNKLLRSSAPKIKREVYSREQHSISRRDISQGALKVMKRLHEAGFEAYLVGGGVRDLLLDGQPKDFDIATSATPEQVKRLFRGARIIGRRFKIVHVRMGREIIETTTFRAHHSESDKRSESSQTKGGMLLRDNVYGDIESDAARRDFTINALYYTSDGFELHDFCGGLHDIKHRTIRMIGDPLTRYREDPVRLLRAVRFAAKLGFKIEERTAAPIRHNAKLLRDVAAARMFDEILKLFMAGSAAATFELLLDYNMLPHLFPATAKALENGDEIGLKLIRQSMINTDKRIRADKRVTPAFLFAALLWPAVVAEQQRLSGRKLAPMEILSRAGQKAIADQIPHTAIPKRFTASMREIWELQLRLPRRSGKQAERAMEHPRFRAAYDFVLLREEAGEDLGGLGNWWTRYQAVDETAREQMVAELKEPAAKRPRRRRKRKPAANQSSGSDA